MTLWVPLTPQSVSLCFFTPSTISIQSPRQSQCPRCNQQPIQCALCPSQLLRGRIGVLPMKGTPSEGCYTAIFGGTSKAMYVDVYTYITAPSGSQTRPHLMPLTILANRRYPCLMCFPSAIQLLSQKARDTQGRSRHTQIWLRLSPMCLWLPMKKGK